MAGRCSQLRPVTDIVSSECRQWPMLVQIWIRPRASLGLVPVQRLKARREGGGVGEAEAPGGLLDRHLLVAQHLERQPVAELVEQMLEGHALGLQAAVERLAADRPSSRATRSMLASPAASSGFDAGFDLAAEARPCGGRARSRLASSPRKDEEGLLFGGGGASCAANIACQRPAGRRRGCRRSRIPWPASACMQRAIMSLMPTVMLPVLHHSNTASHYKAAASSLRRETMRMAMLMIGAAGRWRFAHAGLGRHGDRLVGRRQPLLACRPGHRRVRARPTCERRRDAHHAGDVRGGQCDRPPLRDLSGLPGGRTDRVAGRGGGDRGLQGAAEALSGQQGGARRKLFADAWRGSPTRPAKQAGRRSASRRRGGDGRRAASILPIAQQPYRPRTTPGEWVATALPSLDPIGRR